LQYLGKAHPRPFYNRPEEYVVAINILKHQQLAAVLLNQESEALRLLEINRVLNREISVNI